MIVDFDDLHETNHRLDLLERLHEANPEFKMTAFAVPAYCPEPFLNSLPDWIEVAVHGWAHGGRDCSDAHEAENWTYEETLDVLLAVNGRFVDGFKAPGWQISDGTYLALEELGWWCADHPNNNGRRPSGLLTHVYNTGDHWHGHIQDVCGNGLAQRFPELMQRVEHATSFEFISEAVERWQLPVAA